MRGPPACSTLGLRLGWRQEIVCKRARKVVEQLRAGDWETTPLLLFWEGEGISMQMKKEQNAEENNLEIDEARPANKV